MVLQALHRTLFKPYSRARPPKRRFLPPEVWLTVFEKMEIIDIVNARLTCRSFAALGRIQAFSSFKFFPFVLVAQRADYRWTFDEDRIERRLKRLEYWASDDIAPMVHHCKVDPLYVLDAELVRFGDDSRLIDAFFQMLPRFFNLNHLECNHLPFCSQALSQLCQLRKLRTLEVTDCSVTASVAPRPAMEVTNVHFYSHCSTYGTVEERGNVGWLDVLHPDSIRQIWISFQKPTAIHLRGIATRRSLPYLSAPEHDHVSRHIISIITHPTALEELKIYPYASWRCKGYFEPPSDYLLGTLSLPSLRDYEGPHQFLSWVSTGPRLSSASLTTLDKSRYAEWGTLLKSIHRETISDSIQSLTVCVDDIPEDLLTAISTRFVHIKDLKLHARRVDEDQLITSAMSSFPPGIETVNLDLWYLNSKMSRIKWIKHAFALKSGLFDNYPALRRATCTISGRHLAFDWRCGDKIPTSRVARGVRSVAYVLGILRIDNT